MVEGGSAVGLRTREAAEVTTALALAVLRLVKQAEQRYLPPRRSLLICVTLAHGSRLDEVERQVVQAPPRARVLRMPYAEHEQLIELPAQPAATASLPQIIESLRQLPASRASTCPADLPVLIEAGQRMGCPEATPPTLRIEPDGDEHPRGRVMGQGESLPARELVERAGAARRRMLEGNIPHALRAR